MHVLLLRKNDHFPFCVEAWPSCPPCHLLERVDVVFGPSCHACNSAVLNGAFDDDLVKSRIRLRGLSMREEKD